MAQAPSDDSDLYGGIPAVPDLRKQRFTFLPQLILGVVGLVAAPWAVQVECKEEVWKILCRYGIPLEVIPPRDRIQPTGEYQVRIAVTGTQIFNWYGSDKTIIFIAQWLPWLLVAFGATAGWATGSWLSRMERMRAIDQ